MAERSTWRTNIDDELGTSRLFLALRSALPSVTVTKCRGCPIVLTSHRIKSYGGRGRRRERHNQGGRPGKTPRKAGAEGERLMILGKNNIFRYGDKSPPLFLFYCYTKKKTKFFKQMENGMRDLSERPGFCTQNSAY